MTSLRTDRTIRSRRLRGAITLALGLVMAGALSGCISLGGGSPPQKTYIVVPPGSQAVPVPPPNQ
ncbi:hypothetical protein AiwAL_08560 [Acidiphilium sp. AL]|uniref:Lipoprotein n=1 Tax=Acidiphilium iwatense TaxID=768198 RepID=A0ABS9DR14_9PROT|nr:MULTISPECIES: hypothetical protein [Acidiphilium]MCF3945167.1 hypothetical protein [Acidiphilium iwatense]MCU4160160.1 hypothetical protein [Acidiphilium sp. AL]